MPLPSRRERTLRGVDNVTDEQVWLGVLEGDSAAFGLIWDRHRDRVFRHLLGAGAEVSDAEELAAVAFLELWRRRGSIRFVDGSLLPWLLVTASNVARNARRSRGRYQAFLARLPRPDQGIDTADVVLGRTGDGRSDGLVKAMKSLGQVDRRLLMLTAVEGFTIVEACQVLGLSDAAGKMRLSRLRRRLRTSIGTQVAMEGERT
ncbi:MAG: RNA polymerase sigma factor [Propionibacteriaceae bacterium]|nr:RNA polymerase sigma factor [Propionibacteriaceae bacterium]